MSDVFAEPYIGDAIVGRGFQDLIYGKAPALGVSFTYPIVGEYIVRPVCITFRLNCGVGATARNPSIQYTDAAGTPFAYMLTSAQVGASTSADCTFALTTQALAPTGAGIQLGCLVPVFLSPTNVIKLTARNFVAADSINAIFLILEYFERRPRRAPRRRRQPAPRL